MQTLFKAPHYLAACVKDADVKLGIVTGYLASFNNLDSDNDIIMPGAFTKTIAEMGPAASKPRIKYLLDHNIGQALGKFNVLKEDNQGLYYEAQVGTHALGVDFLKMVESGIITEHSIGYGVVKKTVTNPDADWRDQQTQLIELRLWEGSALQTWGANENTPLIGMKARVRAYDQAEIIIKALHNGTYTDKTFGELEKQLLILQQAIKNSGETTEPNSFKDGMVECPSCGADNDNDPDDAGMIKCRKCNTSFDPMKHRTTQPNDEEKNLLNDIQLLNSRFGILLNN